MLQLWFYISYVLYTVLLIQYFMMLTLSFGPYEFGIDCKVYIAIEAYVLIATHSIMSIDGC